MAKRLYTEDDVRRLSPGAELVLGPQALATPSALDLARERGLRVRWCDGRRAASGAGAGTTDPAARLAELLGADGAYWVQVEGGRARVWRQGPDGPVEQPLA